MGGVTGGVDTAPRVGLEPVVAAIGVSVVSAVGIWRPSLWTDEAATISAARRPYPALWSMLHHVDAVHGLFYAAMHPWVSAFGVSAVALRLPAVVGVGVAGAGTYLLGRSLGGRRLAWLAVVVLAVLPRITWAGTEARSYAWTAAVAVWLTVVLLRALARGGWWWVLYAALAVVGVVLFLFSALLLVCHGITVLWWSRRDVRRLVPWLVSLAAVTAAVLPFTQLAVAESSAVAPARQSPLGALVDVGVKQWFFGAPQDPVSTLSRHHFEIASALALSAVAWSLMALAVVRRRDLRARCAAPVGVLPLLLPVVVVPTVALLAYSAVGSPLYTTRYLTFAAPAVAVLVAAGLLALGSVGAQAAVLGVLCLLALPVYVEQRTPVAKNGADWSTVTALLQRRSTPGDVVLFGRFTRDQRSSTRRMTVAYPGRLDGLRDLTAGRSALATHSLWGTTRQVAAVVDELGGAPRVWLVESDDPRNRRYALADLALVESRGYRVVWAYRGPLTRVDELRALGPVPGSPPGAGAQVASTISTRQRGSS